MAGSVYRVTEVIGVSDESLETTARNAAEIAAKTVCDMRVAEMVGRTSRSAMRDGELPRAGACGFDRVLGTSSLTAGRRRGRTGRGGYHVRMLIRRVLAAVLALIEIGLAALVVWGMATGAHTQRDKGQTTTSMVAVVLGLGAACLVVLGVALFRAVSLWRLGRLGALTWFGGALVLCLVWALCRVIEDSS
jgi:flavin-binding protein dodecin